MKNKLYCLSTLSGLLMSSFAWSTANIETTIDVVLKDLEISRDQKPISYLYEIQINDTDFHNKEAPYQNTFPPFKGKFHTVKETTKTLNPIKLKLAANLVAPEIAFHLMGQKSKEKPVFQATCLLSQEQWDQILAKLPEPATIEVIVNLSKNRCDVDLPKKMTPKHVTK